MRGVRNGVAAAEGVGVLYLNRAAADRNRLAAGKPSGRSRQDDRARARLHDSFNCRCECGGISLFAALDIEREDVPVQRSRSPCGKHSHRRACHHNCTTTHPSIKPPNIRGYADAVSFRKCDAPPLYSFRKCVGLIRLSFRKCDIIRADSQRKA